MQFSSKEDIEVPIEAAFALLSDFETFERSAIRRGVDIQRLTETETPVIGTSWRAQFMMRGRQRDLQIELTSFEPPQSLEFTGESEGMDTRMSLELMALSPRRTRMSVILNLKPKTLSARLFLQSLKLAKSLLTKRFRLRIAEYSKTLEERYRHSA